MLFKVLLVVTIGSLAISDALPSLNGPLKEHTTSAQRISGHGYPSETHTIETSDGYVLNLFRIPYSPKLQNQDQPRPAILLQHGLFSCSDCFLLNGPDNALAYLLADAGYDVWLGNARGNLYSRQNSKILMNDPSFWRFSWHEIAVIDIAEMINYILETTGQSAIHYAGHSQGTTVFFVLMSMRPEYNAKIKTAHMLAPVGYMGHVSDPLLTKLAKVLGVPGLWSNLFGDQEFLPNNPYIQRLMDTACGGNVQYPEYCSQLFFLYAGGELPNINMTLLPQVAETHPAGVSTNQVLHYLQETISDEFRQFDYGTSKNNKIYGQVEPPNYDVEKITSQVYLYHSEADDSANPADVSRLAALLPNLKEDHMVPIPTWSHFDFVFGLTVKDEINDRVIRACEEYEQQAIH